MAVVGYGSAMKARLQYVPAGVPQVNDIQAQLHSVDAKINDANAAAPPLGASGSHLRLQPMQLSGLQVGAHSCTVHSVTRCMHTQ